MPGSRGGQVGVVRSTPVKPTMKKSSPSRRSWFDNATANSLERRRKGGKHLQERWNDLVSDHNISSQTLPRGMKISSLLNYSGHGRSSPALSNLSTHTISDFRFSSSHCDNINLALNNSLPLHDTMSVKSPVETNSSSGVSSATSSHDERSFNFDVRSSPNRKYPHQPRKPAPSPESRLRQGSPKHHENMNAEENRHCCDTEEKLTNRLVDTIRELKDIADVARVIDDVDDEEWLLVFIGELEVHIGDLMRTDAKKSMPPLSDQRQKKEILFRVAQELVRYLKDRFSYSRDRDPTVQSIDNEDHASTDTLCKLKALASEKPRDISSMTKWQRKLSNLACVLDEYLQRLLGQPPTTEPPLQEASYKNEDVIKYAHHDDDTSSNDANESSRGVQSKYATLPRAKPGNRDHLRHSAAVKQHRTFVNATTTSDNTIEQTETCLPTNTSKHHEFIALKHNKEYTEKKTANQNKASHAHACSLNKRKNIFLSYEDARQRFQREDGDSCHTLPKTYKHKAHSHKETMQQKSVDASERSATKKKKSDEEDLRLRCGSLDRKMCRKGREEKKHQLKCLSSSTDNINDLGKIRSDRHLSFYNHDHKKSTVLDTGESSSKKGPMHSPDSKVKNKISKLSIEIFSEPDTKPKLVCEEEEIAEVTAQTHLHQHVIDLNGGFDKFSKPKTIHRVEEEKANKSKASSAQCSIISKEHIKKADEEISRLKKSAQLLRQGITEAREERDEKDRKIAILESRVQRLKKSMEERRSEQGSAQEELEKMKRRLQAQTRHHSEEVDELQNRIEELEEQARNQQRRVDDLEEWIGKLKEEKLATDEKCFQLSKEKRELEEELHDATMALMREKRHSRKLQADNIRLEMEASKAQEARERDRRLAEAKEKEERDAAVFYLLEEAVAKVACEEEKVANTGAENDEAREELEYLQDENHVLANENNELRDQLVREQNISAVATDCFRQQIEFLSSEISVQQEATRAQKEQYDYEIDRLLSTRSTNGSTPPQEMDGGDDVAVTSLRSQMVYQHTVTSTLHAENTRLRKERDQLKSLVSGDSLPKEVVETQDFGCQMDDMSYTRMRAYDFYSQEALRSARRLLERGRNFQRETTNHVITTRKLEADIRKRGNHRY